VNKTVAGILELKGDQVWTIEPDATVYRALELMAERNVGAVVVVDGDELVGIMTERDYARKVVLLDRVSKTTEVAEIMTSELVTVSPQAGVDHCMALMTERRVRHLPVVDGGRLVGLVSIGDVVLAVIADREFMIDQLEQYIQS
jgi:CBS domain-containing protein